MQIEALESIKARPMLARMSTTVLCITGVVALVGWSLPKEDPAGRRTELAMRAPDAAISDATRARSSIAASVTGIAAKATGSARSRVGCAECGVIESVRRIDTREEIGGECAPGDIAATHIPGSRIESSGRSAQVTLADTVADVIAGHPGAKQGRVMTRHQIVVRFRDGSRHVFTEETPRTLRVGDRVQVIAGAAGANG